MNSNSLRAATVTDGAAPSHLAPACSLAAFMMKDNSFIGTHRDRALLRRAPSQLS